MSSYKHSISEHTLLSCLPQAPADDEGHEAAAEAADAMRVMREELGEVDLEMDAAYSELKAEDGLDDDDIRMHERDTAVEELSKHKLRTGVASVKQLIERNAADICSGGFAGEHPIGVDFDEARLIIMIGLIW